MGAPPIRDFFPANDRKRKWGREKEGKEGIQNKEEREGERARGGEG